MARQHSFARSCDWLLNYPKLRSGACMRIHIVVAAAALVAGSMTAGADNSPGYPVKLMGGGTISCGDYVNYEKQGDTVALREVAEWTWGFLSAYNTRGFFSEKIKSVRQIAPPDENSMNLFISNYCHQHPLDHLEGAVYSLIETL